MHKSKYLLFWALHFFVSDMPYLRSHGQLYCAVYLLNMDGGTPLSAPDHNQSYFTILSTHHHTHHSTLAHWAQQYTPYPEHQNSGYCYYTSSDYATTPTPLTLCHFKSESTDALQSGLDIEEGVEVVAYGFCFCSIEPLCKGNKKDIA